MHPSWIFLRALGESVERIEAEERRLFYVALTRSKHSLAILSEGGTRESPYLHELQEAMTLTPIAWNELPPFPSPGGARLEVRVSSAYEQREQL